MSTFESSRTSESIADAEPPMLFGAVWPGDGDRRLWTKAAPAIVVKHFGEGNFAKAWPAWKKHLGRREARRLTAARGLPSMAEALLWGLPEHLVGADVYSAIALLEREHDAAQARKLAGRLASDVAQPIDESAALVYLACAHALPWLAASLSCDTWWRSLAALHRLSFDAASLDLSAKPLLHQWLAGELPLALACLFPEIRPCVQLLAPARRSLSVGFEELLDGEGMPHFRHIEVHQGLIGCWTRAKLLASSSGQVSWNDEAKSQFGHAVQQMLRLSRRDGRSMFESSAIAPGADPTMARFFASAAKAAGGRQSKAALRTRNLTQVTATSKRRAIKKLPRPATRSEWAQVAVLRPSWRRTSPHLAAAYGDFLLRGELVMGRDAIFSGNWPFNCLVDNRPAAALRDWEELCWVSDDDVDYLEVEIELAGGVRLQRQICLAREDRFLFIADAVLAPEPHELNHTARLPLGAGITACPARETREVSIAGRKPRGMVFPLALPEWRVDPRGGDLQVGAETLQLNQTGQGCGLYAPLWIDLDRRRHQKSFTWRQLTVAEERQIVPRDRAAGYRIQYGKRQWLVYRSLTPARNRTVMGHNLSSEFLIARFGRDGSVTPLIEVE